MLQILQHTKQEAEGHIQCLLMKMNLLKLSTNELKLQSAVWFESLRKKRGQSARGSMSTNLSQREI